MMTAMSDAARSRPAYPRLAIGLAWLGSTIAVGFLGWVYFALTDRRDETAPAWVLLVIAALGLVVTIAIVLHRPAALRLSLIASVLYAVGGIVGAALAAADGDIDPADIRLIAGVPIVAAILTGFLRGRAARSATP
jgi:hypothetical protein